MSAPDDIVPRLRLWAEGVEKQKAVVLAVAITEAADEIERLRKELDTRIAMCDMRSERIIELTTERDEARHGEAVATATLQGWIEERTTLRAERDEARRRLCVELLEVEGLPVGWKGKRGAAGVAERMGWDCFKEEP